MNCGACLTLYPVWSRKSSAALFSQGITVFSNARHSSSTGIRYALGLVLVAACAGAISACSDSEDARPDQDTAVESDATESDTTENDATASDATESDATESDTTESDTTESDATESDATESDATESDATESDATENDTTESDATENDTTESDATESDATDGDTTDGDAAEDTRDDSDDAFPVDVSEDVEPDAGPECGDGSIDALEECDDGEANSNTAPDACRTDCTLARCGDGVVDSDEGCDDGDNPGAAVGDCIPGCVGRVEQVLRMRLSSPFTGVDSGFAAEAASFTEAADALCPEGFKAVITDGSTRIATVTPLVGDGQVDWVLEPFTAYYDEVEDTSRWPTCCSEGFAGEPCCEDGVYTGQLVGTTDDVTLLGVRRGEPVALPGPGGIPYYRFDRSGRAVWTGFNTDWTAGDTCSGWTSTDAEQAGIIGNSGRQTSGLWSVIPNDCGSRSRQILCAEQSTP